MKIILSLSLTLMLATAFGQTAIQFPYNPDSNGDGEIGVDDLLGMLSAFGESWELPDPNEWASTSLNALLQYEAYLDSTAIEIEFAQDEINAELVVLDSLTQIVSCNSATNGFLSNTAMSCYTYVGENNGFTTRQIPNGCRHVTIYTGYQGNLSYPLRLPNAGDFVGQTITLFLMPAGNATRSVPIHEFVDSSWIEVDVMDQCFGLNYNNGYVPTAASCNKRFVWDGSSWNNMPGGMYIIND